MSRHHDYDEIYARGAEHEIESLRAENARLRAAVRAAWGALFKAMPGAELRVERDEVCQQPQDTGSIYLGSMRLYVWSGPYAQARALADAMNAVRRDVFPEEAKRG